MEKGFLEKHGFRVLEISWKKEVDGHVIKFDKLTRLWYVDGRVSPFENVQALLDAEQA